MINVLIFIFGLLLGAITSFFYYKPKIEYLKQKNWKLKSTIKKITIIINSKDTIVSKYDKIKELVDKGHN